ncbi:MAG: hypothetical protein U5J99_02980 [Parvularculaceae bacterium]|nr:hypothetical protein [Parvularculaceae bacterium]
MKNITVSIDDETYRRARVAAAANDTTVSAIVRKFLEDFAAPKSDGAIADELFESLRQKQMKLREELKGFSAGDRLSREELYDQARRR